jgi:hypothetical protein
MPYSQGQLTALQVPTNQPDSTTGLPLNELSIPLPLVAFTNRFIDSALVEVPARIKSLVIVVDVAITSAGAQQATVQLFAARTRFATLGNLQGTSVVGAGYGSNAPQTPFGATQAASSQFPTGTAVNSAQAIGQPVAFAGSVASIPTGVYWFSATSPGNPSASPPTSMTELAQEYPVLGIEITAPATFTAGLARAFFELAPI